MPKVNTLIEIGVNINSQNSSQQNAQYCFVDIPIKISQKIFLGTCKQNNAFLGYREVSIRKI
jgi:hypothetical protein